MRRDFGLNFMENLKDDELFKGKYPYMYKNALKIHTWSDSNAVPYLTVCLYTTNKKKKEGH